MKLSQLDGKRIAIVLQGSSRQQVFRGRSHYEFDDDLGNCLRVDVTNTPGNPHFLFPEAAGGYEFKPDWQYQCDYTVTIRVDPTQSAWDPELSDE